jgi:hypothetical protein
VKYANVLMSDTRTHDDRLVGKLERSDRNAWAEKLEPLIRKLSPFPISYDVTTTQPSNFSEYTYTEFAGGVYISTQSVDINCRLMNLAASEKCADLEIAEKWQSIIKDKYKLKEDPGADYPEKIVFLPANNCMELISFESLCRVVHEDDAARVKPHPLIDEGATKTIASKVGWNKMIPASRSGMEYLNSGQIVYSSSCSELCVLGAMLGKEVRNIGSFFHESEGAYYAMTREIFLSEDQRQVVLNMVSSKYSGVIFPWYTDDEIEERITAFFDKSLELRQQYSPLHVRVQKKPINGDKR